MKALEYLKSIGIIENENSKFLIKFEDGREFDVVEILEGYKNFPNINKENESIKIINDIRDILKIKH